jgi:hypothetical protein
MGLCYVNGKSVEFIKGTLLKYLKKKNLKAHEILSDYRVPRINRKISTCNPNDDGFKSDLPDEIKANDPWIKCMHNPLWIRDNIGDPRGIIGEPYQSPEKFNTWLKNHIGLPTEKKLIVLFGLTMEVCVLSVAQELYFRGYNVAVLYEATDPMNERMEYKNYIAYHSTLSVYAKLIKFSDLKELVDRCDINA